MNIRIDTTHRLRDLSGKMFDLVGIDHKNSKALVSRGVDGDTLKLDAVALKGLLFRCDHCKTWHSIKLLCAPEDLSFLICEKALEDLDGKKIDRLMIGWRKDRRSYYNSLRT